MVSLTPHSEKDRVTLSATQEGMINGTICGIASCAGVWFASRTSKSFVKWTNWQSRTALAIMPPLFVFTVSAERNLDVSMRDMAAKNEHIRSSAVWAEKKHAENLEAIDVHGARISDLNTEEQLLKLYRQSVENSGVRIVPGNRLGVHHKLANYWQDNPFKVLAFFGVPAVAYIFYGRSGQSHLQFQMKVMHTRVMGQATVLVMLLGLMGFKSYMDANGKFITEADANERVEEMRMVRQDLIERLEIEKQGKVAMQAARKKARENDVASGVAPDSHMKQLRRERRKTAAKAIDTIGDDD